jgi:Uma2 family endonuclease
MVTATTEQLIQQLIDSPRLPQLTWQFQAILAAEQEKRLRFYDEMSGVEKTEFINGEVIVHSPVTLRHSAASGNLFALLKAYVQKHALGYVGHEKLLITLTRNDYEPDIVFFGQAKAQRFTPDQAKFPAPDFVVEVLSGSTESVDRGLKFEDYALHGVAEYWIIDPEQESVEQYLLQGEQYTLAVKVKTGTLQSTAIPGFDIPARAVFNPDEQLTALQAILR